MNKILVCNWKRNGSKILCESLLEVIKDTSLENALYSKNFKLNICTPYLYLEKVRAFIENNINSNDTDFNFSISIGAQNVSCIETNAITGDISADMLKDVGCTTCIVGHSERRAIYDETSFDISCKAIKLIESNISPIICIGEDIGVFEANRSFEYIDEEISYLLSYINEQVNSIKPNSIFQRRPGENFEIFLAYEPIWSIGTGKSASVKYITDMTNHINKVLSNYFIHDCVKYRVLYGGSVNSNNLCDIIQIADLDGVLIGGGSIKSEELHNILIQYNYFIKSA